MLHTPPAFLWRFAQHHGLGFTALLGLLALTGLVFVVATTAFLLGGAV